MCFLLALYQHEAEIQDKLCFVQATSIESANLALVGFQWDMVHNALEGCWGWNQI
jgi:hypothetical protein